MLDAEAPRIEGRQGGERRQGFADPPEPRLARVAFGAGGARPLQLGVGGPCVAGSLPWKRGPSSVGRPRLPVRGGAGRWRTAVRLARSSWSQGRADVAATQAAVP